MIKLNAAVRIAAAQQQLVAAKFNPALAEFKKAGYEDSPIHNQSDRGHYIRKKGDNKKDAIALAKKLGYTEKDGLWLNNTKVDASIAVEVVKQGKNAGYTVVSFMDL